MLGHPFNYGNRIFDNVTNFNCYYYFNYGILESFVIDSSST